MAVAARDARHPGNRIADAHWRAREIAIDAFAKLPDLANALMAKDHGNRDRQIAVTEVDIGAANAAVRHFDDERARPRIGNFGRFKGEWLVKESKNSPLGHRGHD